MTVKKLRLKIKLLIPQLTLLFINKYFINIGNKLASNFTSQTHNRFLNPNKRNEKSIFLHYTSPEEEVKTIQKLKSRGGGIDNIHSSV